MICHINNLLNTISGGLFLIRSDWLEDMGPWDFTYYMWACVGACVVLLCHHHTSTLYMLLLEHDNMGNTNACVSFDNITSSYTYIRPDAFHNNRFSLWPNNQQKSIQRKRGRAFVLNECSSWCDWLAVRHHDIHGHPKLCLCEWVVWFGQASSPRFQSTTWLNSA